MRRSQARHSASAISALAKKHYRTSASSPIASATGNQTDVSDEFNDLAAFSRNIGWIMQQKQQVMKSKRIAIAGLGGFGGVHLLTLASLGIGAFNIGRVSRAPHGLQFDAYRNKLASTWRPWGHRNPLQRFALAIAKRTFGEL
jgi:hypothetical protein